jgi:hypothetical protein
VAPVGPFIGHESDGGRNLSLSYFGFGRIGVKPVAGDGGLVTMPTWLRHEAERLVGRLTHYEAATTAPQLVH